MVMHRAPWVTTFLRKYLKSHHGSTAAEESAKPQVGLLQHTVLREDAVAAVSVEYAAQSADGRSPDNEKSMKKRSKNEATRTLFSYCQCVDAWMCLFYSGTPLRRLQSSAEIPSP